MSPLPTGFGERLTALCGIDSKTGDLDGLLRSATLLADWARLDGLAAELRPTTAGPIVVIRHQGSAPGRTLLIGHHDTVYPIGTAAARPVRTEGDRLLGPGVADMKGGLLVGLHALAELAKDRTSTCGLVEFWIVPDEEARTQQPACLDDWRGADAAICLECGRADGSIVTTRSACTWLQIEATGRDAHAGTERAFGRSALMALTNEAIRIERDIHAARPGLQATVTQLNAGTSINTVPGHATASIDLRAATTPDLQWAISQVATSATYDGVALRSTNDQGFPPLTRADALADHALSILHDLGAVASEAAAAGASDGSWASGIGIPTIDGLGPIGGGDHAPGEWIAADSVANRIETVRRLCLRR